jgi:hypothetical protein
MQIVLSFLAFHIAFSAASLWSCGEFPPAALIAADCLRDIGWPTPTLHRFFQIIQLDLLI